jgi:putative endonuclease
MYGGCVYIVTNKYNRVLYTGVTSDLVTRTVRHQEKYYPRAFTAKYNCNKLVHFERFARIEEAIAVEKKIKGGSRQKKINLINGMNPEWKDLWEDISKW